MGIGGRVLVAESNRTIRQEIASFLRADGFQVLEASSGLEAPLVLRRGTVEIALVDPKLPEIDGLELVRRVRRESTVPIIMLTASRDQSARIGELELDLDARRCTIAAREVQLTRREFDLLGALLSYPGRVHTREQLLELVWGTDSIGPKTVDVHVAALRRKLGSAISIATLRGLGYRLDPASVREGRLDLERNSPAEFG